MTDPTVAELFAAEENARRVLIRLGEPVPDALDLARIRERYCTQARTIWRDRRRGLLFLDGSVALAGGEPFTWHALERAS